MEPLTTEELYNAGAEGRFGLYHPSSKMTPLVPPHSPNLDLRSHSIPLDMSILDLPEEAADLSPLADINDTLATSSLPAGSVDATDPTPDDQRNETSGNHNNRDVPSVSNPRASASTDDAEHVFISNEESHDDDDDDDDYHVDILQTGGTDSPDRADVPPLPILETTNITKVQKAFRVPEDASSFPDGIGHHDNATNNTQPGIEDDDRRLRLMKFVEKVAKESNFAFYKPLDEEIKWTEGDLMDARFQLQVEERTSKENERHMEKCKERASGYGGYEFMEWGGAGAAGTGQDSHLPFVVFHDGVDVSDENGLETDAANDGCADSGGMIVESSRMAEERAQRMSQWSTHSGRVSPKLPRANTVNTWVAHNDHLLESYASEQINPPLGRQVSVELNEPTQFVTGMLQSLANRGKMTSDEADHPERPMDNLLGGYVNLTRWAREYFRTRFEMNDVDYDIIMLLTIIINNFYEAQMRLVDAIVLQAVQNMGTHHRSSLQVGDFAFSFDLSMSQEMPFFVEAGHRIRDTLEAHRPKSPVLIPLSNSYTTRSGRQSKLTQQAQLAMKAAYHKHQKEMKKMKATAIADENEETSDSAGGKTSGRRGRKSRKSDANRSANAGHTARISRKSSSTVELPAGSSAQAVKRTNTVVHYTPNYGRSQLDTGVEDGTDVETSGQTGSSADAPARRKLQNKAIEISESASVNGGGNVPVTEAPVRKESVIRLRGPSGTSPRRSGRGTIPKIRIPARPGASAISTATSSTAVTPKDPSTAPSTAPSTRLPSPEPAQDGTHVPESGPASAPSFVNDDNNDARATSSFALNKLSDTYAFLKKLADSASVIINARSQSTTTSTSISTPVPVSAPGGPQESAPAPLPDESAATTPTVIENAEDTDKGEAESERESVSVSAPVRRARATHGPMICGRRMTTRSRSGAVSSPQTRSRSVGVKNGANGGIAEGNRTKKRKLGD